MLPAERQRHILEIIKKDGGASVQELAEKVEASLSTVRRDLESLASRGLIDRTHGGAVPSHRSTSFEPVYLEKRRLHRSAKQRIGVRAAELVSDGETLILDSGSTTFEVARHLHGHKDLTVVTNDLYIAQELGQDAGISVLIAGGSLRANYFSIVGPYTEQFLGQINVDKAFLGGDAAHPERGLTNATSSEASVKRLMLEAADKSYLVADHSKFGQVALAHVAKLSEFDRIITDDALESGLLTQLLDQGLRIETV